MSVPAHLHQGSDAWRVYRAARGGASEVAALLGCSQFFPRTPLELWQVKTGRAEVYVNDAMLNGNSLEPAARAYVEGCFGEVFEPQVVEQGRIIASLDGQSFDGKTIIEIKIPAAGFDSDLWRYVTDHTKPPEHYLCQIQQQIMVAQAERCIFCVCVASGDEIVECLHLDIFPDPEMHERIRQAWHEFFPFIDSDTPPPPTDRDVIERSDADWSDAAHAYRIARRALENAQSAEKAARERLQELAGERSAKGCGVSVSRFWRAGTVDYRKALPADIDIEQYRKQGSWQYRITEAKE